VTLKSTQRTCEEAAIVIVPSLDVGSNLRSENQSSLDLDPFVLNCILHGRRLATPQYLSALLQPSRKLDEFPPSIKYSCLLALVAAKLFCTATYRAEHNAQFKMLLNKQKQLLHPLPPITNLIMRFHGFGQTNMT